MNEDGRDHRTGSSPRRVSQSKLSLMHLFRSAHAGGGFLGRADEEASSGATRVARRQGIDEEMLRRHLRHDLSVLLNTVNLASTVPLDDTPHVRRSIVNYGLVDLSDKSEAALGSDEVVRCVRETLLAYEPRLLPGSLEITVLSQAGQLDRCLRLHISAELLSDPVDFSLEVEAELETGAGKLHLARLALRT